MINYSHFDLFQMDKTNKQIVIVYNGGMITNEELFFESLELEEKLCTESELRFGSCEASSLKFKIGNTLTSLYGQMISPNIVMDGNSDDPFVIGHYKVYYDKPTADRQHREIISYDAIYDIINADVSVWYNTILPNADSTVTLKEFRDSFFAHFGIEQEEVTLINDDMIVEKTIEPSELSGKTVITAICEINGCFGHIGRDGRFQYIHLKEMIEGLYPSDTLYPSDDLYPANQLNAEHISKSHYISAKYEDFETARINKLQIRQQENDIGASYPTGDITEKDNCYIVQDNFLVYGKSTEELQTIAEKMLSVICKVWYRPAHVEMKGNPCLEVGDGIRLSTNYEIIYTYILQRTLKGIQALRDTFDAEGEPQQNGDVNSTRSEIRQLKGKANILTRTIEETRSEIIDIEKALSTRITQNAESITLEAKRATEAEESLSAKISINAESITAEVKRATEAEESLSAKISINAESITAEVKRATEAEESLSAKLSINAEQISLKVSKDNIISEINQTAENITISAKKIDLVGLVNADELVSKFATIITLNATKAGLENLIAQKASIESLAAVSASVNQIGADYASIGQLNAQEARINNIEISYISADTVAAKYATINGLNSVDSRIDNLLNSHMQVVGYFGLLGEFTFKNTSVKWGIVNGYKVLMAEE